MKTKIILFLLCVYTYSFSQNRVCIDFNDRTSGDYELILKDILTDNGYKVFINYRPEKLNKNFDFTIKYNATYNDNYDVLNSISVTLYDSLGNKMNEVDSSISTFFEVNEYKALLKALNSLLNKQFKYKNSNSFKNIKKFNIGFITHKIDSTTYSIVAKGAGIYSLSDMENAFLEKGNQYLKVFDYYFTNSKYSYYAPGSYGTFSGYIVKGIIKENPKTKTEIIKLDKTPNEFDIEFKKITSIGQLTKDSSKTIITTIDTLKTNQSQLNSEIIEAEDTITIKKIHGDIKGYRYGEVLTYANYKKLFKFSPEALSQIKTSNFLYKTGSFFGYVGGYMFGFTLALGIANIHSVDYTWGIALGATAGIVGVGYAFYSSGKSHQIKAINSFNSTQRNFKDKQTGSVKIGFTNSGIGLSYSF